LQQKISKERRNHSPECIASVGFAVQTSFHANYPKEAGIAENAASVFARKAAKARSTAEDADKFHPKIGLLTMGNYFLMKVNSLSREFTSLYAR
jgi:hypothetical protein